MSNEPTPPPNKEGSVGSNVFSAKEVRLGIISQIAEDVLSIPETDKFGINDIKQAGISLVNNARMLNGLLSPHIKSPQLTASIDALIILDGAYEMATLSDKESFDKDGFVIMLAHTMAHNLCYREAAKTLGYETSRFPEGYYETFIEENKDLIEATKNSYNSRARDPNAWNNFLEQHKESELLRLKLDIGKED